MCSRSASAFCGSPSLAATARRRANSPGSSSNGPSISWKRRETVKPRVESRKAALWNGGVARSVRGLRAATHICYSYRTIQQLNDSSRDERRDGMDQADTTKLGKLAHLTARHRRKVIVAWIVLTLFGAFAASQVSKRWYQSFSIPGKSAYEANQRTLKQFGTGVRPPNVVVFHTQGDATKSAAIKEAMRRAAAMMPRARTSSYFSTGNLMYVS